MAHTADEFFRVAGMDDIADVAKAQESQQNTEEQPHEHTIMDDLCMAQDTISNLTLYLNAAFEQHPDLRGELMERFDGMPGYDTVI